MLSRICNLLFVAFASVSCNIFVYCCLHCVAYCLLLVGRCLWQVVCCLLIVSVVRYLLFVVV